MPRARHGTIDSNQSGLSAYLNHNMGANGFVAPSPMANASADSDEMNEERPHNAFEEAVVSKNSQSFNNNNQSSENVNPNSNNTTSIFGDQQQMAANISGGGNVIDEKRNKKRQRK